MTRTVPGWPKCQGGGRKCCCPCPRPSSPTPAPGRAWHSPACFRPLPNAPLPYVAGLQHEVSWQTEQFCSEQSLSSNDHLFYHGRSADCVGSPIDCSNWVQLQLYSFHFLYAAWWWALSNGLIFFYYQRPDIEKCTIGIFPLSDIGTGWRLDPEKDYIWE